MKTCQIGLFTGLSICNPDSEHLKTLALTNTDDGIIWEYAKANDFVIVSKDSDFYQRSLLYSHPPKFVYLRIGNNVINRGKIQSLK